MLERVEAMLAQEQRQPRVYRVRDLISDYLPWADGYYPIAALQSAALGYLDCADLPVDSFAPKHALDYINGLVRHGLTRTTANSYLSILKRMLKWGVPRELVFHDTYARIAVVQGVRAGRTTAREPERDKPVPEEDIAWARPFMSEVVRAMVDLQLLTAARPGALVGLEAAQMGRCG